MQSIESLAEYSGCTKESLLESWIHQNVEVLHLVPPSPGEYHFEGKYDA